VQRDNIERANLAGGMEQDDNEKAFMRGTQCTNRFYYFFADDGESFFYEPRGASRLLRLRTGPSSTESRPTIGKKPKECALHDEERLRILGTTNPFPRDGTTLSDESLLSLRAQFWT